MAKDPFFFRESPGLAKLIDQARYKPGVSRPQAFSDWLHLMTATLSGGQLEDQYVAIVPRRAGGQAGRARH